MKTGETIPFYVPWITEEDEKAACESLKSRWLTGGPKAAEFEQKFAEYIGVKHAIAVNSCTAGLHLAMRILNIKPADEVIVPVLTFAATANAAIFCGGKPVFADIDEKTFNISPSDILNKITKKTKAIIPVHYGGQSCDMKEILEIAEDHNLQVVEDCAHSLGAEYDGKQTGSFGLMGCFSFYPTKILTTLEGGMITTNNDKVAKKLKLLREHGMSKTAFDRESGDSWYYDVVDLGYNYRLTELQSSLGLSQLGRVNEGNDRRVNTANYYTKKLSSDTFRGIVSPYTASNRSHVFHLYVIKILSDETGVTRDEVFRKLTANGIGAGVHYTPLHLFSFYKKFLNSKPSSFPTAERVYEQILSLPLYPTLTNENVNSVTTKIQAIINREI